MIYTHDKALQIVEEFDNILVKYGIEVPSPEDDERDPDDMVGLYGTTYADLLDIVEDIIIDVLNQHKSDDEILVGKFSGTI